MATIVLVLLILALAVLVAAAVLAQRSRASWGTLVAAGLALFMLVQVLGALPG
jgi:cell division protein FtsW (lipid II flippase)